MLEEVIKEIYLTKSIHYKNKTPFKVGEGSPVYGEITQNGTNTLVNHFRKHFNKDTVFYDLGSGLGKMVLHIGLQYNVKKSVGIELSKERHKGAVETKEKYVKDNDKIEFHNLSFFKYDMSDATVIYCDNTAIADDIGEEIYKIIPSGCLFLFKRRIVSINDKTSRLNDIERTYRQKELLWIVKE